MVNDWNESMKKMRAGISQLSTPEAQQDMEHKSKNLAFFVPPIDQVIAADSQEQFDTQSTGLLLSLMDWWHRR